MAKGMKTNEPTEKIDEVVFNFELDFDEVAEVEF